MRSPDVAISLERGVRSCWWVGCLCARASREVAPPPPPALASYAVVPFFWGGAPAPGSPVFPSTGIWFLPRPARVLSCLVLWDRTVCGYCVGEARRILLAERVLALEGVTPPRTGGPRQCDHQRCRIDHSPPEQWYSKHCPRCRCLHQEHPLPLPGGPPQVDVGFARLPWLWVVPEYAPSCFRRPGGRHPFLVKPHAHGVVPPCILRLVAIGQRGFYASQTIE